MKPPLLSRSILHNFLGLVIPLLVAGVTIPWVIRGLGVERFGILTLAWVMINYVGLFDLGVGRALTYLVAEQAGKQTEDELTSLIGSALLLLGGLGAMGGICFGLISPWLVDRFLHVPPPLRLETHFVFYLLAGSLPVILVSTALRGVLEAWQLFHLINRVRIPLGVFTFIAPLLVFPFTQSLFVVVGVLLVGRFAATMVYFYLCAHVAPSLYRWRLLLDTGHVRRLISVGGWMTAVNLLDPLMVYFDRFVIGALLSMGAVAYYATPFEVVTKLWVLPGALVGVLFPVFSTAYGDDRTRVADLFMRATTFLFWLLFPIILMIVLFASPGLHWWLGGDFAEHSTRVLQWLALGLFMNSLGQIAFVLLQGAGRPDLVTKLYLCEFPLYVGLLWFAVGRGGVVGAAMLWTLRMSFDAIMLFFLSIRRLPVKGRALIPLASSVGVGVTTLVFLILWYGQ